MSRRTCVVVLLASLLSAVSGALLAQQPKIQPFTEPVVLAGPDVGFRIESYERGKPVGTLVVRLNGRWVEARSAMQAVPLGSR